MSTQTEANEDVLPLRSAERPTLKTNQTHVVLIFTKLCPLKPWYLVHLISEGADDISITAA